MQIVIDSKGSGLDTTITDMEGNHVRGVTAAC